MSPVGGFIRGRGGMIRNLDTNWVLLQSHFTESLSVSILLKYAEAASVVIDVICLCYQCYRKRYV